MIYIVLPVFNEEKNIRSVIKGIRRVLKDSKYCIVVVNDGSKDMTSKILLQEKGKDVLVVSTLINMNIGAVFANGIYTVLEKAKSEDILVIMESDQTSSPSDIPALTEQISKHRNDIAIASRYVRGGGYRNFPFTRRIFSFFASFFMQHAFPIDHVRDYTIFFRAYKVSILQEAKKHFGLFGLIQSKGFVANAELLVKLSLFTDKVVEIPFIYDYAKKEGKSKIAIFRTINEYFVAYTYLQSIYKKIKAFRTVTGQSLSRT